MKSKIERKYLPVRGISWYYIECNLLLEVDQDPKKVHVLFVVLRRRKKKKSQWVL